MDDQMQISTVGPFLKTKVGPILQPKDILSCALQLDQP